MTAVLYFSRADENLINGKPEKLTKGNTQIVAEKIALKLGCQSYCIEPAVPYPNNYQDTVGRAKKEKNSQYYPELKEISLDLSQEKNIFLGFPNWWGTYPRVIASFLRDYSMDGKMIYPFCTHEGSAFGNSLADLKKTCPKSVIQTGLSVQGSRVAKSDEAVKNWLCQYYCNQKDI
ncbi:flavodoxin [Enterococcus timonensis]|uniref:flavodoxin n=1 Tax=Enterococcus timonensis TaxID=1852364 RepID=UPI0008DA2AB6|nr:flavodoxin [Enterococcus timonensis]